MKVPFNINLSGKTAIVTGGSGTLCSAMAYGLAVCGAKVAIMIKDKQNAISGDNHFDIALSCMTNSFENSSAILPCCALKIKNKKQITLKVICCANDIIRI